MTFKVYSRKSVYTGKGESIENQIEMCKDYIFHNYPGATEREIEVYEDEGYSGKSLDRPEFQKMMADIKRDKPDCVVCYRLDRISRNVGDFASLIEKLNDREIAFVCIKEKFDTSTPMGKAMMYIASVFAQLERETIAERVRDNMLMLAKLGRWLGGTTPTGFASEKVQEVIMDGKIKSSCMLKENPDEIDAIHQIYDLFLRLRSLNGVRKELARQGAKARSSQNYSLPGIKEILQNPVYCTADEDAWNYFTHHNADVCFDLAHTSGHQGILAYNKRDYTKGHVPRNPIEKWIIAAGKHKGQIPGKQWVAVQEILEENRHGHEVRPNTHNDYSLLSGAIYCKKCGKRMFAKSRSGANRTGFDYICQDKMQLGAAVCDCQNLGGQNADDTLCEYLLSYDNETSSLYQLLERLKEDVKKTDTQNPVKELQRRIDACGKEIDNLIAVLAQTGVNATVVAKVSDRVTELGEELKELQAAKHQAEAGLYDKDNPKAQLGLMGSLLADFKANVQEMSIHEKRIMLRLLVQKCEWDGENFDIFIYGE